MRTLPGAALGALLLTAAGVAAAPAQLPGTPRALGMGGAHLAAARGYEALYENPANLALPGTPGWSLGLPQLGASGTLLGPALADLPDLLSAGTGDARQDEILARIPGTGAEVQYDVRAPLAAVQVGGLAVGLAYGSVGGHSLSRDIVELLAKGYDASRTDYSVGSTAGSRASFWDLAAAYGRRVGPFAVGVTGHYLRGGTLERSRMFEPRIDVEARDVSVTYLSVLARGGSGYSVDVGAALEASPSLTLSAAISNLAGRMRWSEELTYRDLRVNRAELDEQPARIWERYRESEKTLDSGGVPVRVYDTAQGLYDGAVFPALARVGADWRPFDGTSVGAVFQARLGDGDLAGRWSDLAAVGVQQKLLFLTARAGYATNLGEGSMLSGGLSVGPVHLGLARLRDEGVAGAPREGWAVSAGVGIAGR